MNSSTDHNRFLEIDLGGEKYGVHLLSIKEVIPQPEMTALPNSPEYFTGIINLRGMIISVIDLRKKLKIKPQGNAEESAVVIVDIEDFSVGLIVDSINRVISFDINELVAVPQIKTQINAKFIHGIYRDGDQLTVILDLKSVLNLEEIKKIKN